MNAGFCRLRHKFNSGTKGCSNVQIFIGHAGLSVFGHYGEN
jgi:hypothetical protein